MQLSVSLNPAQSTHTVSFGSLSEIHSVTLIDNVTRQSIVTSDGSNLSTSYGDLDAAWWDSPFNVSLEE